MNLNDLLSAKSIDPRHVLVLRHRPHEPELNKVFPWLVAERPDLFNAYQQSPGPTAARAMQRMVGNGCVASFIRHGPGRALFVGLFSIGASRSITQEEFWRMPANAKLKEFGVEIVRESILWFDLDLIDFYPDWKGKLVVSWPPPERSWFRRAHRNEMRVLAVLEDSALDASMPEWDRINLSWEELSVLPTRWKSVLSQWRGIYYIFDSSDGKGYVGAAYGDGNIHGRWINYAARGHGGNWLLRPRDPRNFRFTILQRVSPDMDADEVIRLEASWKQRLHTRAPNGLNDN